MVLNRFLCILLRSNAFTQSWFCGALSLSFKGEHMCGGANFYLNSRQSRFSGVYLVLKVFRDIWPSNKENPSVYLHATLSCPFLASNYSISYLVPISFRSRSDLVLISDHALDFLSDLAFQACISSYSVPDKSGARMFLPCSIINAFAHIVLIFAGRIHNLAGFARPPVWHA